MSGTSLDGLDIAYVTFTPNGTGWKFKLQQARTLAYNDKWKEKLARAHELSATDLLAAHTEYGRFIGKAVNQFIRDKKLKAIDFIASHGHTIFHQPSRGFTFQLGCGQAIHTITRLPVIYDFRSLDVIKGGEGAPLVPLGDRHLFSSYHVCVNLGGIANLSMERNKKRLAFDVCFCNMGLNFLTGSVDLAYDKGGKLAKSGFVHAGLLEELTRVMKTYHGRRPSLGREMFTADIQPILNRHSGLPLADRLRTWTEATVNELVRVLPANGQRILCTGGGAFNNFLIDRLKKSMGTSTIEVPSADIVAFKEAIVFAFLGLRRMRNEVNVLSSVTHATTDSCAGLIAGEVNA